MAPATRRVPSRRSRQGQPGGLLDLILLPPYLLKICGAFSKLRVMLLHSAGLDLMLRNLIYLDSAGFTLSANKKVHTNRFYAASYKSESDKSLFKLVDMHLLKTDNKK